MAAQGQFKVIQGRRFWYQLKALMRFHSLVFNINLGRILRRFGVTLAYRSDNRKNRPFEPTPLSQIALAGGPLANFSTSHTSPESEVVGLSDGE